MGFDQPKTQRVFQTRQLKKLKPGDLIFYRWPKIAARRKRGASKLALLLAPTFVVLKKQTP
jgi:hypothetical protein